MAVFTSVSEQDLQPVLAHFALGDVTRLSAISEGIENTNYFLDTQVSGHHEQNWVLTLFENLDEAELPYFCALTQHLAGAGFKVPAPLQDAQGESLFRLQNRWAVLVPRLRGRAKKAPEIEDCASVGRWLGRMHQSVATFQGQRRLVRDRAWLEGHHARLSSRLSEAERQDLAGYVKRYGDYEKLLQACPQGTVHGDLFRDNVLFEGRDIAGVIDFYHACSATLLFDLAVVANDWTVTDEGKHKADHLAALVEGYQRERPWVEAEHGAWAYCLEVAALRFWVSRLATLHEPGDQQNTVAGVAVKDPEEMRRILHGVVSASAPVPER